MADLKQAINAAVVRHGSLSKAARALQVDLGYLSKLRSGEKKNPSPRLLRKLGVRRVITLEFIDPV